MQNYRKRVDKIFKKLNQISQGGIDYIQDFKNYIDEIVDSGEYTIFEDVMFTKYGIDISNYNSIDRIKSELFEKIRFKTTNKSALSLKKTFDDKNVYQTGYHFYDKSTNKYLGDIIEVDSKSGGLVYNKTQPDLNIVVGDSQSINFAISPYGEKTSSEINYTTQSQCLWFGVVYDCTQPYKWRYNDPITPTYSQYWTQSQIPTYSVYGVTGSDKTLSRKYDISINLLRDLNK